MQRLVITVLILFGVSAPASDYGKVPVLAKNCETGDDRACNELASFYFKEKKIEHVSRITKPKCEVRGPYQGQFCSIYGKALLLSNQIPAAYASIRKS